MALKLAAMQNQVAKLEAERAAIETVLSEERLSWERQRDALASELSAAHERAVGAERERDALRRSYQRLKEELELIRRRIVVATAERADTQQLRLEFAVTLNELEKLAETLDLGKSGGDQGGDQGEAPPPPPPPPKAKPKGRRPLGKLDLPIERIELRDPGHEALLADGKATFHGFEKSYRVMYQRGGHRIVELARAKYRTADEETGETRVRTTPRPKELLDGTIFAPSLAADILYKRCSLGLPFYRQERDLSNLGVPVDRGTMSRMAKLAGELVGDTVVRAMFDHSLANAFCIATDATGLKVQPTPRDDKKRQPCKRAHVLTLVADRDHILFKYLERETGAAIAEVFATYRGYVQADAKSVFDVLFRPAPEEPDAEPPRKEVGCWSHLRRKFWEATVGERTELAREGLRRIGRIFELDALWKDLPSRKRKQQRDAHLRPHVDAFLAWCEEQRMTAPARSWLAAGFGYAARQNDALRRFLEDGRLKLDNNRSERALRNIAIGRKNYLFVGSDEHAAALVNIYSLEASARLHGLDVAAYFRDVIRVLPYWPRDRFIELCPRDWAKTRARLDPSELEPELGPITVPPADTG
jgi:transposase